MPFLFRQDGVHASEDGVLARVPEQSANRGGEKAQEGVGHEPVTLFVRQPLLPLVHYQLQPELPWDGRRHLLTCHGFRSFSHPPQIFNFST